MAVKLGILGGMSWVSTQDYYRVINEKIGQALGRQHSAELVIASVDFQQVVDAQVRGDWNHAGAILTEHAQALERAGARAFLVASNTMHRVIAQVEEAVNIPALNIFDATTAAILRSGKKRLGLLGTRYTMDHPFYRTEYERRGVNVIVPDAEDARKVNEIIFRELIHNVVRPESSQIYREIVERLVSRGVDGVILGCTEIGLLLKAEGSTVTLFDTSTLHASMAADWLLRQRIAKT